MKHLLLSFILFTSAHLTGMQPLLRGETRAYTTQHIRHFYSPSIKQQIQTACTTLNMDPTLLDRADTYFCDTKGYDHLQKCIARNCYNITFLKGYMYELEIGVALHENGDHVCAFHHILHSKKNKSKRELDLYVYMHDLASKCVIECKHISWFYLEQHPHIAKKIKRQVKHQHIIVEEHNAYTKSPIKHCFYSKNPIPKNWKMWFEKQNIIWVEGSNPIAHPYA